MFTFLSNPTLTHAQSPVAPPHQKHCGLASPRSLAVALLILFKRLNLEAAHTQHFCREKKFSSRYPGAQRSRKTLQHQHPSPPLPTEPVVEAVGGAGGAEDGVQHQVGVPHEEVAVEAGGDEHQVQLLYAPHLQPALPPSLGESRRRPVGSHAE